MDLQLEDYWKVVRPRRAKPVGGPILPLEVLEPLTEWVRELGQFSSSYQVLPGSNRLAYVRYLKHEFQSLEMVQAKTEKNSDLTESILQLLRDSRVHENRREELSLDFDPPVSVEWDLIWCFLALPSLTISSNLMDAARKNGKIIEFYNSLTELRLEAFESRVLISLEEGIQRLTKCFSGRRRDRLDTLFFLLALAFENGLVDPFLVYIDTKDTTIGLLDILQSSRKWEFYPCPLKLLIGCQDSSKFPPALHRTLAEGLDWQEPVV